MESRSLTKITTPRISQVIPRKRLFERLRQIGQVPALWVAGPAGSGKTSLVTSYLALDNIPAVWYQIDAGDGDSSTFFYYLGRAAAPFIDPPAAPLPLLTPEYLMGMETFTIRYFERLFQHLNSPVWIVFDNFQELPADSTVPMILAKAAESAPQNVRIAIISRHDPPPTMARLLANRMLAVIGNDQLAFSLDECRELIDTLGGNMPEADIARLHRVTEGWAAGMILYLLHSQTAPGSREWGAGDMPAGVFDYFAGEVLNRTDDPTRRFLLQTALMPHMTAETAGELTGMPAAEILDRLIRRNFFLEKRQLAETSYQYHPLFSDFLGHRAALTFDRQSLAALYGRAAGIMHKAGYAEAAVALYFQAEDHDAAAGIIFSQAPRLVAQGRNRTLCAWIDALPAPYVHQNPWLLFWKGLGLMPDKPMEGHAFCVNAFEHFKRSEDMTGQIVSWSVIVESLLFIRGKFQALDRWIPEGERIGDRLSQDLGPDVIGRFAAGMLGALLLRHPCHPGLVHWQTRCETLLQQSSDQQVLASLGFYLCWSFQWLGQLIKTKRVLDRLEAPLRRRDLSPINHLGHQLIISMVLFEEGRLSQGIAVIENALSFADSSGIHLFDFMLLIFCVHGSLGVGELETARHYLEKVKPVIMPQAIWDNAQLHYAMGNAAAAAEDWPLASYHLENCQRTAEICGTPVPIALALCAQAHIHLQQNELALTLEKLDRVKTMEVPLQSGIIHFHYELMRADCARARDHTEEMLDHLRRAFTPVSADGIGMPLGMIRPRLAVLCAEALQADIHPDLVTQLISRMRLTPPPRESIAEHWPWPIKLYTLGRLEIIKQGQVIDLGKKPPKKPLELLMLLVSGVDQGITRDAAADHLWPDADGDRAVQNLNTTLHRLRKLLGNDQAVLLEGGRLRLNPSICWSDAWQFELLTEKTRSISNPSPRMELLERAVCGYGCALDNSQHHNPLIIGYHQQIRAKWMDSVITLCRLYDADGRTDRAEALLQKALSLDPSAEPICRSLMTVLGAQGRIAEALLVFNRCRGVLSKRGVKPDQETLSLARNLEAARISPPRSRG